MQIIGQQASPIEPQISYLILSSPSHNSKYLYSGLPIFVVVFSQQECLAYW